MIPRMTSRMRQAFELGVGVDLALPLNSWALPLIYTDVGFSFMSSKDAGGETDLSGTAFAWNLGLGVDLYLNPHWHVGLRVGVALRLHRSFEEEHCPDSGDCEMVPAENLEANLVGGFVGLSSGYQF